MAQKFLTRIILIVLFVIFLLIIFSIFFGNFLVSSCKSNQESAMANLVKIAISINNPTLNEITTFKVDESCVEKIELKSNSYIILFNDKTNTSSAKLPINIDPLELKGCTSTTFKNQGCTLPDSSGADKYKVLISPLNLKFMSSQLQ